MSTPSRGHKCSAAPPTTVTVTSSKRARTSGATALEGLASSITLFGDSVAKALASPPSKAILNATHLQQAILRVQKTETWLPTQDIIRLIQVFEKNSTAVGVYLALENDEVRKMWIQNKLEDTVFS